jgi:UDP-N-acetylmuramoylalanine--D-glutamate ligase
MTTFPTNLFAGQRFAVVGLGKNGLPAAFALTQMGASVVAWDDTAKAREAAPGLTIQDPREAGSRFDAMVLSPGIPHLLPKPHPIAVWAREAGIPILSDTELLFQAVRRAGSAARFVGITGTNGKSTTTALLAHVLTGAGFQAVAGANLGPAALSLPLLADDGVYVLEMSSYMLERLATLRFDVAAMLNLSVDHLDRHGDMDGYAMAKRAVFGRQRSADLAAIGIDDALSRDMAAWLAGQPARVATISGLSHASVWTENGMLRDADGPILPMAECPTLPGSHNAQNAAAVAAMATFLGADRAAIAQGLRTYAGLPHRQQLVGRVDGVSYINDSKATNADAAQRALVCYDRLIWIAGGMAKEDGIVPLIPLFPRIAHAMLIGRDTPILAATLREHGVPFTEAGTLENAVTLAAQAATDEKAPVVLLSPACASWDQFTGYDQRGDRFAELVRDMEGAR